jgi:hypothetical protein
MKKKKRKKKRKRGKEEKAEGEEEEEDAANPRSRGPPSDQLGIRRPAVANVDTQ